MPPPWGEDEVLAVCRRVLGGWTLNAWIARHPESNIATVVYDRSPLQERAAYVAVHDFPFLTWLAAGKIVREFSQTPYPPVPNGAMNIGIILESRATKLVRKHKETALSLGEVRWDVAGLGQDCDDYLYTLNNHDEMYHDLAVIGDEVLYFIRNGRFTPDAPRNSPGIDPFSKEKPAAGAAGGSAP